jgi:hypothetical protein
MILNHNKSQPHKTSRLSRKHLAHLRSREERRTFWPLSTSYSLRVSSGISSKSNRMWIAMVSPIR